MSKNNLKNIEILYFIKSFLKKDFPSFLSKDFSSKVMSKINVQPRKTYFQYFTKLAIASSFAIVTLALIKVISFDAYNFESTTLTKTKTPVYNTSNQQIDKDCQIHKNNKAELGDKKCE